MTGLLGPSQAATYEEHSDRQRQPRVKQSIRKHSIASNFYFPSPFSVFLLAPSTAHLPLHPQPPPNPRHPDPCEAHDTRNVAQPSKQNHAPVRLLARALDHTDQAPRNRNPRQRPERHQRIARSIIPPIHPCITQLSDANRREADIRPAREAEQRRKDNRQRQPRVALRRRQQVARQPEREARDQTHDERGDHGVEAAELVGDEARGEAAEAGAGVDDGDELVGEGGGDGAGGEGVAGEVRDGGEEAPLDEEDADGGEEDVAALREEDARGGEHGAPVGCERRGGGVFVGVGGGGAGAVHGGEAGAREEDAESAEEEHDEAEDARGPCPAELGEEALQHQWVDHAGEGAAGRGDAGGGGPATVEPVGDGGDGGCEEEGAAQAGKKGENKEEGPVRCAEG